MERNLARVCPENGATSRGKARQCRVQQKRSSRSVARSFTFTLCAILGVVKAQAAQESLSETGSQRCRTLRGRISSKATRRRADPALLRVFHSKSSAAPSFRCGCVYSRFLFAQLAAVILQRRTMVTRFWRTDMRHYKPCARRKDQVCSLNCNRVATYLFRRANPNAIRCALAAVASASNEAACSKPVGSMELPRLVSCCKNARAESKRGTGVDQRCRSRVSHRARKKRAAAAEHLQMPQTMVLADEGLPIFSITCASFRSSRAP